MWCTLMPPPPLSASSRSRCGARAARPSHWQRDAPAPGRWAAASSICCSLLGPFRCPPAPAPTRQEPGGATRLAAADVAPFAQQLLEALFAAFKHPERCVGGSCVGGLLVCGCCGVFVCEERLCGSEHWQAPHFAANPPPSAPSPTAARTSTSCALSCGSFRTWGPPSRPSRLSACRRAGGGGGVGAGVGCARARRAHLPAGAAGLRGGGV